MEVWFTRSNGDYSVHSIPERTNEYVQGEPAGPFNYRLKCLEEGFARIGWPNVGDLLDGCHGRLAVEGYSFDTIESEHRRFLREFASIKTGDVVLIPADRGPRQVHLGKVVRRTRRTREQVAVPLCTPGYYFFHDVPGEDWYECAHRVDVQWTKDSDGEYAVYHFPTLLWRKAFSRVVAAKAEVLRTFRHALF